MFYSKITFLQLFTIPPQVFLFSITFYLVEPYKGNFINHIRTLPCCYEITKDHLYLVSESFAQDHISYAEVFFLNRFIVRLLDSSFYAFILIRALSLFPFDRSRSSLQISSLCSFETVEHKVRYCISKGMTTYVPYTNENEISFVTVLGLSLRTFANSSTYFPFSPSNRFRKMLINVLLGNFA